MSEGPSRWFRPLTLAVLLLVLVLLLLSARWPTSDAGWGDQSANPGNTMQAAESF